MAITARQVLKYTLLPEFWPRIKGLFSSGFSCAAMFMAVVYRAVRLLPAGHPYLDPENAGRFGIRHVIAEAACNLKFRWANIDQVIIFFTLLAGMAVLALQFVLFGFSLFAGPAFAGDMGAFMASFFVGGDPTYDIAFRLLERTFGIDIYGSCVSQNVPCAYNVVTGAATGEPEAFPLAFHAAMRELFLFYNTGVLAVGVIILLYFSAVIVAETAHDGTPFGRRFNHAWAPVRLFLALGMLVPFSADTGSSFYGFNGAQMASFYVVKWGSNAASNGWNYFVTHLAGGTPIGEPKDLMAHLNAPSLRAFPEFMFVAATCKVAYKKMYDKDIKGYVIGGMGGDRLDLEAANYETALDFAVKTAKVHNIIIRFGEADPDNYKNFEGYVRPICGEISVPIKDYEEPGARLIQYVYYDYIRKLWSGSVGDDGGAGLGSFGPYVAAVALRGLPTPDKDPDATPVPDSFFVQRVHTDIACIFKNGVVINGTLQPYPQCNAALNPVMRDTFSGLGGNSVLYAAREEQVDKGRWIDDYSRLGWGGAAIWYNKIAQMNGALVSAVYGPPLPNKWPEVMETVLEQRRQGEMVITGKERFNPSMEKESKVVFNNEKDRAIGETLYTAQNYWQTSYEEPKGNAFLETIASIFGLQGLFSIRENLDVNPLAQLSAMGRSLVESAITNLGFAFAASVVGGLANILQANLISTVGFAAAGFAKQVGLFAISLGFVLYYIVPFLPFIYFFFAVGGWVKAIFEAMVAMPLWALAHVRIDGEGIPGRTAMNGYFLMFEIFLRPTLTVLGLVGGVIVFSAQVQVLNAVWDLATTNITGSDHVAAEMAKAGGAAQPVWPNPGGAPVKSGLVDYMRGEADQLFHTIMYVIVVYMMGMSSFKLIDILPQFSLRWMNSGARPTTEQVGDPAAQLVHYAFSGSQAMINKSASAFSMLVGRNK